MSMLNVSWLMRSNHEVKANNWAIPTDAGNLNS